MARPHPRVLLSLAVLAMTSAAGAQVIGFTPCVGGEAAGFACDGIDLLSWVPVAELGGGGQVADIWGWRDPETGREYAIVTRGTGTSFVDVTEPTAPVVVGDLPVPGGATVVRDVKVYRHVALMTGEDEVHGLQVFDLRQLRTVADPPRTFETTFLFDGIGHAHNLAVDEESGFAYVSGTSECSGLYMLDLADPLRPELAGCFAGAGPSHDAQCTVYRGRDARYVGRQICFDSSRDELAIVDVTDKASPRLLSRSTYPGLGFVHQGWLTDDHAFFLLDDELDESRAGHGTRTYVFELDDLEAPRFAGFHESANLTTDHNQYVVGDHTFQANYSEGLRILRLDDLTRAEMTEVASFDTVPGLVSTSFIGAWSVYPFFPSGTLVVSSRDEGLFVLGWHGFTGGCALPPGHGDYCTACGPCGAGDGDCDRAEHCAPGLVCADDVGADFGFGPGIDVCVVPDGGGGGCALPPGHGDYCRECGTCGAGEGDCDRDTDCAAGLVCAQDVGADFGFGSGIDVCVAPGGDDGCPLPAGHGDYCRECGTCGAGEGDCDRDTDCAAGLVCGEDVGADFGFGPGIDVCVVPGGGGGDVCPLPPGHGDFCNQCGVCGLGEGDCDRDSDCGAGLTCVQNVGADWGFGPGIDVCQ